MVRPSNTTIITFIATMTDFQMKFKLLSESDRPRSLEPATAALDRAAPWLSPSAAPGHCVRFQGRLLQEDSTSGKEPSGALDDSTQEEQHPDRPTATGAQAAVAVAASLLALVVGPTDLLLRLGPTDLLLGLGPTDLEATELCLLLLVHLWSAGLSCLLVGLRSTELLLRLAGRLHGLVLLLRLGRLLLRLGRLLLRLGRLQLRLCRLQLRLCRLQLRLCRLQLRLGRLQRLSTCFSPPAFASTSLCVLSPKLLSCAVPPRPTGQ